MISILIPIEKFSFFVHTCYKNIVATCGVPRNQLDIVFAISPTTTPQVLAAIEAVGCRTILIDMDFSNLERFRMGLEHQIILDNALQDSSLSEWVIVQHCDWFWMKNGWMHKVKKAIADASKDKSKCVIAIEHSKYIYDRSLVPLVGDFFGVYRRDGIKGLTFRWGRIGMELSVSDELTAVINAGRITPLKMGEWVDGSVAMSLELHMRNQVHILDLKSYYVHIMAFYRIYDFTTKREDVLNVGLALDDSFGVSKAKWSRSFAIYSFLTSFMFELEEIDMPIPWVIYQEIAKMELLDLKEAVEFCEWIKKYAPTPVNTLDMGRYGINEVVFDNRVCYKHNYQLLL